MIPCFPRHARRIRLEWRTVRSIVKRILVTCAATTALALLLTMVLCALGNAMAPKWQVEPFTDHITLTTTNTAIQAVDPATGAVLKTPQEGAYRTKETHITVALDGGKTVNAIVREPLDAPADRPACLFLHGSGTGKSSEAFGDVANAMASAGITTLVPDKRLDNYTMLHRDYVSSAHDYAKSMEILRKWPGVSRSETGIYAESEGTWIATVLTQQHPDLAFAILTSPPVVSGRQQMTLAATNYLTAAGAPDAVKQLIPRITSLGTQRMGLAYADFDAAKYRRSLTMPLLINYGVKDTAMPVEQGARLLIKAANQAGNTNVTLRYYDANHPCFVTQTGFPGLQNADGDAVWASATYRRIAANASCNVSACTTPIPGTATFLRSVGTTAVVKPRRAASRSRYSSLGTGRTCPVNEISPIAHVVRGIGFDFAALANAATIARSQPGSRA